jgi:TRAP-type C4-dicarboxylate transport system substrate-binding protein
MATTEKLNLTIATTHPTTLPWAALLRDYFVPVSSKKIETIYPSVELEWHQAYGTLYKWQDSLNGLKIGLSDIGWVGSLWESSRLPLQNITYDLPFITDDLSSLLSVMNDLHHDIPAMQRSWLDNDLKFLAATGTDTYHLVTNFPIRTLADLKGKKILAPGAASIWLEGTGATAVNGALTTYYTQLKTGVADGALTILSGAYPFRLHEVAKYVTLVGIGAQFVGALAANIEVWDHLPIPVQEIFVEVALDYSRLSAEAADKRYKESLEALKNEGAIFYTLPLVEKEKWMNSLPPLALNWVDRHEANNLPAQQVLNKLMQGLKTKGAMPVNSWGVDLRDPDK